MSILLRRALVTWVTGEASVLRTAAARLSVSDRGEVPKFDDTLLLSFIVLICCLNGGHSAMSFRTVSTSSSDQYDNKSSLTGWVASSEVAGLGHGKGAG